MILASQSPRRKELLESVGFTLSIIPADIDETPLASEEASAMVERLAQQKLAACLAMRPSIDPTRDTHLLPCADAELAVASDTTVWLDAQQPLGKPLNNHHAAELLSQLSGTTHTVSTAVALAWVHRDGSLLASTQFVEHARVTMYPLSDEQIQAYIATGEPMDKAGAYAIQGFGSLFVKQLEGDIHTVIGLPLTPLLRAASYLTTTDLIVQYLKGTHHASN